MSVYDLIIVGGGISGLRVGIEALKTKPNLRCCILEKYAYIGGRAITYKKDIPTVGQVQWENGAGRISTSHKKVLKLLKNYNLHFIPNRSDTFFINRDDKEPHIETNQFTNLLNVYIQPLESLPIETLQKYTLKELLDKTIGPISAKQFYEQFPYYAEIHTLRADIAIESFRNEMRSNEGFGSIKEGFSALTNAMMTEFISRGGTIIMDTDVYRVKTNSCKNNIVDYRLRNTDKKGSYDAKVVILALHSEAVSKIDGVSNLPVLRHLKMMPLLRMYAVFPTHKGISWFSNLGKIVTNSPIRYIIPINAEKGIVMISYTDGKDANWWFKQDSKTIENLVMTEIKKLFPDRSIPDPLFFKQHPWYQGCTYWLPGNYNIEEESLNSLHPLPKTMPHLFMCGESFAVKQCWVESALEQADKLLDNKQFRNTILKKYEWI